MSHDDISQIKTLIEEEFNKLDEKSIQQRSGHHSNLLKELKDMNTSINLRIDSMGAEITSLKAELSGWKLGSKIGITVIVALGALITWVLNSFGVKIGIK